MNQTVNRRNAGEVVNLFVSSERVEANLSIPAEAQGIVLFAHGTGSSRHNPRNNFVAEKLRGAGLATLLIDLLTEDEKRIDRRTRRIRFDIDRLAEQVTGAIDWLPEQPTTDDLNVGIFGSSTGAAGALIGASNRPDDVPTVVSRGGRVDLAEGALGKVRAPALFIVGGDDVQVRELNRQAMARMEAEVALEVVPGAGDVCAAGKIARILVKTAASPDGGDLERALIEFNVSPAVAATYKDGLADGDLLFWVRTSDEDAAQAAEILRESSGRYVGVRRS